MRNDKTRKKSGNLPALIGLLFAAFFFSAPLQAHVAYPKGSYETEGGMPFLIEVWEAYKEPDGSLCKAWIQVTSDNTAVAAIVEPSTVEPTTDAVFEVTTGTTAGASANITIHYIGEYQKYGTGNPSCSGEEYIPLTVTLTAPRQAASAANKPSSGSDQDPVNTANGELYFHEPADLYLGGPMPLFFQRYYGSFLQRSGVTGNIGNNWRHNFEWNLQRSADSIAIVDPSGRVLRFARQGGLWQQQTNPEIAYQLVESGTDVILYDPQAERFHTFDKLGRLATIADGRGNTHYLFYSLYHGKLEWVTDRPDNTARGLRLTYWAGAAYPSVANLAQVRESQNSVTSGMRYVNFTYTEGNLTSLQNVLGNTTTYGYTAEGSLVGLLTSKTTPVTATQTITPYAQTYDSQGRVATQTDSDGHTTGFAYDFPSQGVTTVTSPTLGLSLRHTHSGQSALTQWTDRTGRTASMTYDALNRRTSLTDRLGDTTQVTYHAASGKVASVTDNLSRTTSYTYTARAMGGFTLYDLTRIAYPDGTTIAMTYDASGNMLTYRDRADKPWSFTYNGKGQVLTETNPTAGVTTATYNADGTLATLKDHFDNSTSHAYDTNRRLATITHPIVAPETTAATRTYTYNKNDDVLTWVNERNNTFTLTYDMSNRLKTVKDPLAKTMTLNYDGNDRLLSVVDKVNATTTFAYDAMGRISSKTNAAGETTEFGYDGEGRPILITNPGGRQVAVGYDQEGVVSSVTDPLGKTWNATTDKLGRMTGTQSPLGAGRVYVYDAGGWLTRYTNPLLREANYGYDGRGALASVTLPGGIGASYTRNDLGPSPA